MLDNNPPLFLWPGEPSQDHKLHEALRVDLAGEEGAKRIYEGQLQVLKHSFVAQEIHHMYEQEARHAQGFQQLVRYHHTRPSLFSFVWHYGGFFLGWGSALLGTKGAMACTVGVENVIDRHYQEQIRELSCVALPLCAFLEACRLEEVDHAHQAIEHGALDHLFYRVFSSAVSFVTKTAIVVAKRF